MKKIILIIATLVFLFAVQRVADAQCSMCKATVESNMKTNENFVGKGLNHGILYLMSIPYILGVVAFGIYFHHRKKKANQEIEN